MKLFNKPPKQTVLGTKLYTNFMSLDRYEFDYHLIWSKREKGWLQWDTDQDDWYFGIWVNPIRLQIFIYAEGDLSLEIIPTREMFDRIITRMESNYGPCPPMAISIDNEGNKTKYYDNRYTPHN